MVRTNAERKLRRQSEAGIRTPYCQTSTLACMKLSGSMFNTTFDFFEGLFSHMKRVTDINHVESKKERNIRGRRKKCHCSQPHDIRTREVEPLKIIGEYSSTEQPRKGCKAKETTDNVTKKYVASLIGNVVGMQPGTDAGTYVGITRSRLVLFLGKGNKMLSSRINRSAPILIIPGVRREGIATGEKGHIPTLFVPGESSSVPLAIVLEELPTEPGGLPYTTPDFWVGFVPQYTIKPHTRSVRPTRLGSWRKVIHLESSNQIEGKKKISVGGIKRGKSADPGGRSRPPYGPMVRSILMMLGVDVISARNITKGDGDEDGKGSELFLEERKRSRQKAKKKESMRKIIRSGESNQDLPI
ncbi:hypothetical protein K438DRAFT_1778713 [Mycena galopus ATCC 62051]|nr:hypothetical protein K438DRAFT_1778713 [Mycena galopus ATCC 62051]